MIERIIIAGAGGQGVMLLGKVLAQAAMRQGEPAAPAAPAAPVAPGIKK